MSRYTPTDIMITKVVSIFSFLLLLSGTLFAQQKTIMSSPLSEALIYEFLTQANPEIDTNPEIAKLATEALAEWAKAIAEIDRPMEKTFVQTNQEYVIICNLWLESEVGDRGVQEMLFDELSTLIIKNMTEDTILECIKNAKEAGVSFLSVIDTDHEENIEIFLILLRYPTND